jgi:GR25 family glycosyltransferase involved in LPS biosynthesis
MTHKIQDIKVYVINLDRRQDRWNDVQKSLKRAGFTNIERVSAIDGKLIDSNHLKQLVHPSVYPSLGKVRTKHEDLGSVGAVGCYLSHYKVWKMIEESGQPSIIVEDDLVVHPSLNNFDVTKDTKQLEKYDFVLLASVLREFFNLPIRSYFNSRGIIYPHHGMFFHLHFYYLTPRGASYFLMDALPMKYQVDSYMSFKIKKTPDFLSAVHKPDLGDQLGLTTDIQTPRNGIYMYLKRSYRYFSQSNPQKSTKLLILILIIILILILLYSLVCSEKNKLM